MLMGYLLFWYVNMVVIATKGGEKFDFPRDLFNVMEMTNTHLSYSVFTTGF